MEAVSRKPLEGVRNIIRFNWQFYVLAAGSAAILWYFGLQAAPGFSLVFRLALAALLLPLFVSLLVSAFVYDLSGLYSLDWLLITVPPGTAVVNIHAGFDETSTRLSQKYPQANLTVLDFYDPEKHTEVSIRRARKTAMVFPGTSVIDTSAVPLERASTDFVFCFFAAHEIRRSDERTAFFRQLCEALTKNGTIVVAEHLRDLPNFLAYTVGFFHFYPARVWKRTFAAAGLRIANEHKHTPFIRVYYLQQNGTAS